LAIGEKVATLAIGFSRRDGVHLAPKLLSYPLYEKHSNYLVSNTSMPYASTMSTMSTSLMYKGIGAYTVSEANADALAIGEKVATLAIGFSRRDGVHLAPTTLRTIQVSETSEGSRY
jgi:hypothetical protein